MTGTHIATHADNPVSDSSRHGKGIQWQSRYSNHELEIMKTVCCIFSTAAFSQLQEKSNSRTPAWLCMLHVEY